MARGWESKSIEDQISEREAEAGKAAKERLTPQQMAQLAKRESLLLARSRTLSALESARDERYRSQLQQALAHLDTELSRLNGE